MADPVLPPEDMNLLTEVGLSFSSDEARVWETYSALGKALNERDYAGATREKIKRIRKVILSVWPSIRFDSKTRKLRDSTLRKFSLLIDDQRNSRMIGFPEAGTAPTFYSYPDRARNIRTREELLAFLAQSGAITQDTHFVVAQSMSSIKDYWENYRFRPETRQD